MRVIICENYEEMSKQAAKLVISQVTLKPESILGLATGSTPIGMYDKLIEANKAGEVDFSKVTTFNLDEYYPLSADNDQSYHYFMNEHLFSKTNIPFERTHVPDGEAANPEKECEEYDKKIEAAGGIDLQILGIGQNGHIGFNEPDKNLIAGTHLTELTDSTIEANSRFFEKKEDVPTKALTMGIASILKSKKIIIMANGAAKHEVVSALMTPDITTDIPATMLKIHSDVVVICDKEAFYGKQN
ncbi:MAG: glucosamine-6-phosphate deaminase [Clostridia bacterium]|nr:glucosamine-6-phosphate deaminase [Clostridia bacterium]